MFSQLGSKPVNTNPQVQFLSNLTSTDLKLNCVVTGDKGVGKTTLLRRLFNNQFKPKERFLHKNDFKIKYQNKKIQLEAWE